MADLAIDLNLPILIVARPQLGTLNHTYLTTYYATSKGLRIVGIIISGYNPQTIDIAEQTNPEMLEELCKFPVLGKVPLIRLTENIEEIVEAIRRSVDLGYFKMHSS